MHITPYRLETVPTNESFFTLFGSYQRVDPGRGTQGTQVVSSGVLLTHKELATNIVLLGKRNNIYHKSCAFLPFLY